MKKLNPLKVLPALFLLCSCASVPDKTNSGPDVTACVVDRSQMGYQCAGPDHESFFVPFDTLPVLNCVTTTQLESFFKSCKRKEKPELEFCTQNCADNSFCTYEKDWNRILDRCKA